MTMMLPVLVFAMSATRAYIFKQDLDSAILTLNVFLQCVYNTLVRFPSLLKFTLVGLDGSV